MKKLLIMLLLTTLFSCIDKRFIQKEIKIHDYSITWYYYSYITDVSPDFISFRDGRKETVLFESVNTVSDIMVRNDTILIRLYKPKNGIIYTKDVLSQICGYKIILDSSVTYYEHQHRFDS